GFGGRRSIQLSYGRAETAGILPGAPSFSRRAVGHALGASSLSPFLNSPTDVPSDFMTAGSRLPKISMATKRITTSSGAPMFRKASMITLQCPRRVHVARRDDRARRRTGLRDRTPSLPLRSGSRFRSGATNGTNGADRSDNV